MLNVTLDVDNLSNNLKGGKTFTPPKREISRGSKLQNLKYVEGKYKHSIEEPKKIKEKLYNVEKGGVSVTKKLSSTVLLPKFKKGIVLDVCVAKLVKGNNLKIKNVAEVKVKKPKLKKGLKLLVTKANLLGGGTIELPIYTLVKGKDLTKHSTVKKYIQLKIRGNVDKKENKVEMETSIKRDISSLKKDKYIVDVKDDLALRKEVNKVKIGTTELTKDSDREQKRESNTLVKERREGNEVDKGVVFKIGMTLYEFLKENPKKRTEDVVLKYFKAKDLKDLVNSGKVLKKRGKLII